MSVKIPTKEREAVRTELVLIADRLIKNHNLTIPEARHAIREILDVSV